MKRILIAFSLLLGLVLAVEWLVFKPQQPTIEVRQPPTLNDSMLLAEHDETKFNLPPLEEYKVIEQRPLFIEGRRVLEEKATAPVAPPLPPARSTPPPVIDLRGIIIVRNEYIALLGRPAEKNGSNRLKIGSKIKDWTVTAIKSDQIVMENAGEKSIFSLRKFKSIPLPAIPAVGIPGIGAKLRQVNSKHGKSPMKMKPPAH